MRAELVQLGLQLGDAARRWPGPEPALQGLVEPFGLALGLGVSRGPVLLTDPEDREDVFEGVASAGEPGGVDAPVIGQRRGWRPVFLDQA